MAVWEWWRDGWPEMWWCEGGLRREREPVLCEGGNGKTENGGEGVGADGGGEVDGEEE